MEITTKILNSKVAKRADVPSDNYVAGLILRFYKNLPYEGERVLDLGGCTGVFAVYAALRGAEMVATYEPEEKNYEVLVENTYPYDNILPYRRAVTLRDDETIPFYLTTGQSTDGYSTVEFRGRTRVDVPNTHFRDVLELHRPTVIKMNIEGGEYELMQHPLPDYVKAVVMDIHFTKKHWREQLPELTKQFEGWDTVMEPKNTGRNFHTKGLWIRK